VVIVAGLKSLSHGQTSRPALVAGLKGGRGTFWIEPNQNVWARMALLLGLGLVIGKSMECSPSQCRKHVFDGMDQMADMCLERMRDAQKIYWGGPDCNLEWEGHYKGEDSAADNGVWQ